MTLRDFLALTKFAITSLSTLSAAAGYMVARPGPDWGLAPLLAGTLLLAMGASALNEVLERDLDARMTRTRNRPLPRGAVGVAAASGCSAVLSLAGTGLLLWGSGASATLLGLGALGWYALVYTPLKRVTAFAVVPGAVIGALPPAMGWSAAGGSLAHPGLLCLCLVFFLWQVPHFWLLSLMHGEEYARAGLPTLARHFSAAAIQRLTFAWICATAAASCLLPVFGTPSRPGSLAILGAAILVLVLRATCLLRAASQPGAYRRSFGDINRFILALMAALMAG